MTLTPEQQTDLQTLRTAAEQREWTTLQDTLKRLLAELDPLIALQIAATRTREFLPTFETAYPEAGWVRELLLTVVSYGSAPSDLPEGTVNQFPSPGCGNFVVSVLDCARAVQPKYTVFERFSHITNATANAILAELQYQYFSDREDAFTLLMDAEADQHARAQVQYDFWLDEAVAARDTAIWQGIADELEALLSKK